MTLSSENSKWLEEFHSRAGRKLRVLHIGNIANNAYNNAKLLNEVGLDCDVICYDYYHIMGCPEWEDANCDTEKIDHQKPAWYSVDLGGFSRPTWFAQGPLVKCLDYLIAKRGGDSDAAMRLWEDLCISSGVLPPRIESSQQQLIHFAHRLKTAVAIRAARIVGVMQRIKYRVVLLKEKVARSRRLTSGRNGQSDLIRQTAYSPIDQRISEIISAFKRHFPNRDDVLSHADLLGYIVYLDKWTELFKHYDIVIGYSTDSIYSLLANKRPYVAYEHGTIRDIPSEKTTLGRIASIAYAEADVVLLTNADSLPQARRLHAQSIVKGLHGFDPRNIAKRLESIHSGNVPLPINFDKSIKVFLAPARQHWKEGFPTWRKGNDRIIRAVASLASQYAGRFKVVFIEWGAEVSLSKQLIDQLGIADFFHWIPPLPKNELLALYSNVDCVIDQFILPCIGSVTLEAIALGCPVITALDDKAMEEFYGASIPLLNCHQPDEIAVAMSDVINASSHVRLAGAQSKDWFHTYHTGSVLIQKLMETVRNAVQKSEGLSNAKI